MSVTDRIARAVCPYTAVYNCRGDGGKSCNGACPRVARKAMAEMPLIWFVPVPVVVMVLMGVGGLVGWWLA